MLSSPVNCTEEGGFYGLVRYSCHYGKSCYSISYLRSYFYHRGDIMDINAFVNLVGSLGFPIVCCGALFYQQNKSMKELADRIESTMKEISSRTESAADKMSENLEKNTLAINTLVTTVTVMSKRGDNNG